MAGDRTLWSLLGLSCGKHLKWEGVYLPPSVSGWLLRGGFSELIPLFEHLCHGESGLPGLAAVMCSLEKSRHL